MVVPVAAPFRPREKTHLRVAFERAGRRVGAVATTAGLVRWGPVLGIEFTYPVPGLQAREDLFVPGRGGARLLLHPGLAGTLRSGSSDIPVEDLGAWGLVQGRGKRRWVQLTPDMEGRVEYRGLVVAFHHGPPPSRGDEVRLGRVPLRFRRGLLSREEWPFALFTWAVYGLLLYGALHLTSVPLPDEPSRDRVARRFVELVYRAPQAPTPVRNEILTRTERQVSAEEEPTTAVPEEVPRPPPEPQPQPAQEQPRREEPTPATPPMAREPPPESAQPPGPVPKQSPVRTREEIRKSVANKGLLGLLGGKGTASTTRVRGTILEGAGAARDLDRVLEQVEGLRTAPTAGGEGDGVGVSAVAEGIDVAARQAASAGTPVVDLATREDTVAEVDPETELDPLILKEAVAAIHKTVGTYLGGIRYLYNRELRKNPDLEGKLAVRITISPEGAVLDCEVVEDNLGAPELIEAVLLRIRKWKFPPVAPRELTVTYPFVFFPSM